MTMVVGGELEMGDGSARAMVAYGKTIIHQHTISNGVTADQNWGCWRMGDKI